MKAKLARNLGIIGGLAAAIALLSQPAVAEKVLDYPSPGDHIEVKIHAKTLPLFPLSLKQEGYTQGEVELIIEIDEFGELRDYIVSMATRPEFAKEVERVIHTWDFEPPRWGDKTIPVITRAQIYFESTGNVITFDLNSGLMNRISSMTSARDEREKHRLARPDDLDAYPNPRSITRPQIPKELVEENTGAVGIFNFYIDQIGRVRMPSLERVDGDPDVRVLSAVQDALEQWRFDPPTVNGKPVIVIASQPFTFSAENDS